MPTTPTIATPTGNQTAVQINAARAAIVAAGGNPYAGAGATNLSKSAGLGGTYSPGQQTSPTPSSSGSTTPNNGSVDPNTPTQGSQTNFSAPGGGGLDQGYNQAEADITPMSEDQIYAYWAGKNNVAIQSAQETEAAAEQAANTESIDETSAMNFGANAAGLAGSSEANSQAQTINTTRNQAITTAQATRDAQLATIAQNIDSLTQSDYENQQNTVAPAYIAAKQTQMATSLAGISAQGMTLAQFQQSQPTAYAQLLQYAGGDANSLAALFVSSSSKNLMNNGQPIASQGNTFVYGVQTVGPNGKPTISTQTVTIPNLPTGYKVSSYNQAANGTVTYVAFPTDAQGNQTVNPSLPNNGVISGIIGGGSNTPVQGLTTDQQTALNNLGLNSTDQTLVVGIASGLTPPPSGFGSNSKDMMKVKAGLVALGFNTTTASLDYTAMNDYMSTMNGTQQVRLKEAAASVPPMLTNVQSDFNDFVAQAPQWGITAINSVSLAAAVAGTYGSAAQTAAVTLNQQITDITSDLGTIYKGGNSATDQALQTGAEQLSGTWDSDTFTAALAQIQQNIGYRVQAINAVGVGGVGANNPYATMLGVNTGTDLSTSSSDTSGSTDTSGSNGSSYNGITLPN